MEAMTQKQMEDQGVENTAWNTVTKGTSSVVRRPSPQVKIDLMLPTMSLWHRNVRRSNEHIKIILLCEKMKHEKNSMAYLLLEIKWNKNVNWLSS